MKKITATFPSAELARTAVDALADADIEEANVSVDEMDDGSTVVTATVDDEKLDAAAAILDAGSASSVEDWSDAAEPTVESHPDGSGPVVIPLVPTR